MRFISQILEFDSDRINLIFDNGEKRQIYMYQFLKNRFENENSIYRKLLNPTYFQKVGIDSYGALSWNNEIDFCPDVIYMASEPLESN